MHNPNLGGLEFMRAPWVCMVFNIGFKDRALSNFAHKKKKNACACVTFAFIIFMSNALSHPYLFYVSDVHTYHKQRTHTLHASGTQLMFA